MEKYLYIFDSFTFSNFVDIVLVYLLVYNLYRWVSRTRALPVLQGFLIIIFLSFVATLMGFEILNTILTNIVSLMLLAVIILFPAEIKRVFYQIGSALSLGEGIKLEKDSINELVNTVRIFKREKIGCLMVLQRRDSLLSLQETGVGFEAEIDKNILYAIFQKGSPLHDGAVIVCRNRLVAAGCYVSALSYKTDLTKKLGTRHRAALGLSEQSDAFILVVSEETGGLSFAYKGGLNQIGVEGLRKQLRESFLDRQRDGWGE